MHTQHGGIRKALVLLADLARPVVLAVGVPALLAVTPAPSQAAARFAGHVRAKGRLRAHLARILELVVLALRVLRCALLGSLHGRGRSGFASGHVLPRRKRGQDLVEQRCVARSHRPVDQAVKVVIHVDWHLEAAARQGCVIRSKVRPIKHLAWPYRSSRVLSFSCSTCTNSTRTTF